MSKSILNSLEKRLQELEAKQLRQENNYKFIVKFWDHAMPFFNTIQEYRFLQAAEDQFFIDLLEFADNHNVDPADLLQAIINLTDDPELYNTVQGYINHLQREFLYETRMRNMQI